MAPLLVINHFYVGHEGHFPLCFFSCWPNILNLASSAENTDLTFDMMGIFQCHVSQEPNMHIPPQQVTVANLRNLRFKINKNKQTVATKKYLICQRIWIQHLVFLEFATVAGKESA